MSKLQLGKRWACPDSPVVAQWLPNDHIQKTRAITCNAKCDVQSIPISNDQLSSMANWPSSLTSLYNIRPVERRMTKLAHKNKFLWSSGSENPYTKVGIVIAPIMYMKLMCSNGRTCFHVIPRHIPLKVATCHILIRRFMVELRIETAY
jgi:hypothetical protein